jgi:hypothetical protein
MIHEEHWWIVFSRYIYNYGIGIFNVAIGFCYAIVGILFGLNKHILNNKIHSNTLGWIVLISTVFLSVVQFLKQNKKDKSILQLERTNGVQSEKIQKLENQIQTINKNSKEIFDVHLSYLFLKLALGDNDRISLYKYEGEKFFIIGRYSSNPELKKVTRASYPKEGLISKAWEEKKFFKVDGIPVPNISSRTKFRNGFYKIINDIAPIEENTLWNMKMKSRSFYLKAFDDFNGLQRTSILVIESKNERAFLENNLDNIIDEEEKKLVAFVEKVDWKLPDIINAVNVGF